MMRSVRGYDTFLGFAVAVAMSLGAATVNAGELFVMPYSCAVASGRPILTPSDDQGYSVIGHREQREFSACSPMNPMLCKQWTLYRFDLDCGGTRVPWVSIAAAASGGRNGRSWVEHGRLHIEMPARWSMAPDDPCAQPFKDENRWRPDGFTRMCVDRQAARGPIIEIPDGYAPMMGLDGIFVAKATPPPFTARNSSPVKTARPALPKPAPSSVENSASRPAASPSETLQPKKDIGAPPPSSVVALDSHPEVAPKIINQGNPQQNTTNANASPASSALPSVSPNPAAPLATASISAPTGNAAQISETTTASVPSASVSSAATPLNAGIAAAMSLAVLGLIALTFFQWRERAQLRLTGSRDLAAISLGDGTGRDITVACDVAPVSWTSKATNVVKQPTSLDIRSRPSIGDEIPETREQALQVLGMGVTPEVHDAAIKKIVDGLRQSWHPDHAQSAEERQLRELRMKQINAAWDIISDKRSA